MHWKGQKKGYFIINEHYQVVDKAGLFALDD
jgi:hypothetical protein